MRYAAVGSLVVDSPVLGARSVALPAAAANMTILSCATAAKLHNDVLDTATRMRFREVDVLVPGKYVAPLNKPEVTVVVPKMSRLKP